MIPSPLRIRLQRSLKRSGFRDLTQRQQILEAIMPAISDELNKQWLRGEESANRFPRGEGG